MSWLSFVTLTNHFSLLQLSLQIHLHLPLLPSLPLLRLPSADLQLSRMLQNTEGEAQQNPQSVTVTKLRLLLHLT